MLVLSAVNYASRGDYCGITIPPRAVRRNRMNTLNPNTDQSGVLGETPAFLTSASRLCENS